MSDRSTNMTVNELVELLKSIPLTAEEKTSLRKALELTPEEKRERVRTQNRERARRNRAGQRSEDREQLLAARRAEIARLTPEEKRERVRAKARERGRLHRESVRLKAASSPEASEKLREKWRAQAKKAYAAEKSARESSPKERERFREKWRKKAQQALEKEVAGRSIDAPDNLRKMAMKRKEYRRRHQSRKYAEDLHHKLSVVLRSRLRSAIRNGQKRGSAISDLGCTVGELKDHLESLFRPGMTWDNFGHGSGRWCVDHFFPMKLANLDDRAHVLAVCNWRNLRPEWFSENVRKSGRETRQARALFEELVESFRTAHSAAHGVSPTR